VPESVGLWGVCTKLGFMLRGEGNGRLRRWECEPGHAEYPARVITDWGRSAAPELGRCCQDFATVPAVRGRIYAAHHDTGSVEAWRSKACSPC
jgi:hypothetical protein